MKVTKTSVHRLTIEKTCGCQATREYEDARYTKPLAEGVFSACEKHEKKKNKLVAEFAGEMLLEALDKEAETGKNTTLVRESVPTALSGTSGERVQSMGAPNVPKSREKVDPLRPRTASFNRPDARRPHNTSPTGNLNLAEHEDISDEELKQQGITITGDIDNVPEDPAIEAAVDESLGDFEDAFDDEDARVGGVSQKLINIASNKQA